MQANPTVAVATSGLVAGQQAALQLFNVTLPWSDDGDPTDDAGTYSEAVWAVDEEDAIRQLASVMARNHKSYPSDDEERRMDDIEEFIQSRVDGWSDVVSVSHSVASDLANLFAEELFPDGVARNLNMAALRQLLLANRDALVIHSAKVGHE